MWKQAAGVMLGVVVGLAMGAALHSNASPKQQTTVSDVPRQKEAEPRWKNAYVHNLYFTDDNGKVGGGVLSVNGNVRGNSQDATAQDGSRLIFTNWPGDAVTMLALSPNGAQDLFMVSTKTNATVCMGLDEKGSTYVRLEKEFTPYSEVMAHPDRPSHLSGITLSVDAQGNPSLTLVGPTGKKRVIQP